MSERRLPGAKKFEVQDIGGVLMTFTVVSDLDPEELQAHFNKAFDDADFEYCALLVAEGKLKGVEITLKSPE